MMLEEVTKEKCATWPFDPEADETKVRGLGSPARQLSFYVRTYTPQLLDGLIYDQQVGPEGGAVTLGVQVDEVQSLDDLRQTLSLTAAFNIEWTDPRLAPPVQQ